jgi:hypothetical protein
MRNYWHVWHDLSYDSTTATIRYIIFSVLKYLFQSTLFIILFNSSLFFINSTLRNAQLFFSFYHTLLVTVINILILKTMYNKKVQNIIHDTLVYNSNLSVDAVTVQKVLSKRELG